MAAVSQVLALLERLARRHLLQPPLPHPLRRGILEESAFGHVLDDVAHRQASPDEILRQVIHVQEKLIVEDEAMVGVDRAQAVRHVIDGLVKALELRQLHELFGLALGDVLDQRHPVPIAKRAIVDRKRQPVRKLPDQAKRLAPLDQRHALAIGFLDARRGQVAALGRVAHEIDERRADAHDVGREPEHRDVTLIEQGDALIGIDDTDALRHALERCRLQCEHGLGLKPFGAHGLNATWHAHRWTCPPCPGCSEAEYVSRMEFRVNPIGLNCMRIAPFAFSKTGGSQGQLNFWPQKPTNNDDRRHMSPAEPIRDLIRGVDAGFPPARSPGMVLVVWINASAGVGRSDKIMRQQQSVSAHGNSP